MSKETPEMTNVKGYFNPQPYVIQIAISECNLSIRLEPMQFILIKKTNQKVNDPILDRYVGPKALSPEFSSSPVPIVKIPVIGPPVSAQPGYVVGQGHKDKTGKWIPPTISEQPANLPTTTNTGAPIVASSPSIKAMSVEEARRQGFIGRPKLVPEDFGASETDGAPVEGAKIPRIRYAMESKPKALAARPQELPQELLEQVNPRVAPLLQGLKAAAARDPETANMDRSEAERAVSAQMGDEGVKKFRMQVEKTKLQQAPAVAPQVRKRIAQPVAAPEAEESPLVGGSTGLPQPVLEEQLPTTAADRAGGAPIRCGACGKEFTYPSWYVKHVHKFHKDRLTELLPNALPEVRPA